MDLTFSIVPWLLAGLFGACFAGLAWALGSAWQEAMESYTEVYAEDTARALDEVFLFIPAHKVLQIARIAAVAIAIAFFLLFGRFDTGRGWLTGAVFCADRRRGRAAIAPDHPRLPAAATAPEVQRTTGGRVVPHEQLAEGGLQHHAVL
jgi:hypothetical protein